MLQSQDLKVDQEKKPYIKINTRELDKVSSTELSILYTKLLVYATVPLTYPRGHMLSLRSTYIKHVVVILFLLGSFTMFYYDMSLKLMKA